MSEGQRGDLVAHGYARVPGGGWIRRKDFEPPADMLAALAQELRDAPTWDAKTGAVTVPPTKIFLSEAMRQELEGQGWTRDTGPGRRWIRRKGFDPASPAGPTNKDLVETLSGDDVLVWNPETREIA
ncbi:hypothetical protein ABT369_05375 [Dactylosporangium sp. NPDC000244]|uniref:hypothetical protein n=1 Tax=Dactylosporangium sp. NPDC000244 TaxID=3154365 RepID=UPI0033168706